MLRTLTFTLALVLTLGLAACGGDTQTTTTSPQATTPEAPAATPTAPTASEEGVRTITITPVGNEMKFAQEEITVEAGETVRVVFDNTPATSPAMQHNVVFITDHSEINRVGQAAMEAAANDYVPNDPAVIAATPLAAPGEIVEVTFTAPETPGDYAYICTFPGHYMMMQGTLKVVAPANA